MLTQFKIIPDQRRTMRMHFDEKDPKQINISFYFADGVIMKSAEGKNLYDLQQQKTEPYYVGFRFQKYRFVSFGKS